LRKIGGILLGVGVGILIGWGLYWFFRLAFLWLPLPAKIAIAAIVVGLVILLASLVRERHRESGEDARKFKGVEK
jgi:high-affinity Fe2+/Pb2+ permease